MSGWNFSVNHCTLPIFQSIRVHLVGDISFKWLQLQLSWLKEFPCRVHRTENCIRLFFYDILLMQFFSKLQEYGELWSWYRYIQSCSVYWEDIYIGCLGCRLEEVPILRSLQSSGNDWKINNYTVCGQCSKRNLDNVVGWGASNLTLSVV